MASSKQYNKKNNDILFWGVAVAAILSGFAVPLGVIMIVLKLADKKEKPVSRSAKNTHMGARTSQRVSTAKPEAKAAPEQSSGIAALHKKGKRLVTIGSILTGIFGLCSIIEAVDCLWILPDIAWYLQELIPLLCFTGGGLGLLWAGSRKQKRARRYRNYLAMIGRQNVISVSALASAAGCSSHQVREDLEDMLNDGLLPSGFLDYGSNRLILTPDGLRPEPEPTPASPQKKEVETESSILTEIRQVNDSIANEKMSAQIDRIGIITAKILDYQKTNSSKAPQLHSFLSYYLPTTLKILRAYAQLEAQGVSGENISAAMARIEGMMDKVVEGFEKQLDLLFLGDTMDITTDVEVLERMLAKDGLSGQEGMTLTL